MTYRRLCPIALALLMALQGCATSEDGTTDEEAQATVVEPQEESDDPTADEADEAPEQDAAPPQVLSSFEAFFAAEGAAAPADDLRQYRSLIPRADMAIETQCHGMRCENLITFDGQRELLLQGPAIAQHHLSPDGSTLAWPSTASNSLDESILFIPVADLADLAAQPGDDAPRPGSSELAGLSTDHIEVDALHRVEPLSARALEEARQDCSSEDAVHLPTFLELSADAEPYSEALQISFERWIDDDQWLFSTESDGDNWTSMNVDTTTDCMERFSTNEPWPTFDLDLEGPQHTTIAIDDAWTLPDGDHRSPMALITATIHTDEAHEETLDALIDGIEAHVDHDVQATVLPRHLHLAELDWWHRQDRSTSALKPETQDPPTLIYGAGGYGLPISIVVDGQAPDHVELSSTR